MQPQAKHYSITFQVAPSSFHTGPGLLPVLTETTNWQKNGEKNGENEFRIQYQSISLNFNKVSTGFSTKKSEIFNNEAFFKISFDIKFSLATMDNRNNIEHHAPKTIVAILQDRQIIHTATDESHCQIVFSSMNQRLSTF